MCIRDRLCIDIVEHTLIPSSPNNDTDKTELLKTEDLGQSASDNDVPQDALKYLAGYIAFKCRFVDESLGVRGETLCLSGEHSHDWISIISRRRAYSSVRRVVTKTDSV